MTATSVRILLSHRALGTYAFTDNPWRAPGSAPVIDPCGQVHILCLLLNLGIFSQTYLDSKIAQAGGKYKQTPVGGDSVFATVSLDGKTYQVAFLCDYNNYQFKGTPSPNRFVAVLP